MTRPAAAPAVLLATVLSACATAPRGPEDPVEEARVQLVALTGTTGDAVCAAGLVERDRLLGARSDPRWAPSPADRQYRWLEQRADAMNLTQLSAQLSQAHDAESAARQAARDGVPGARLEADRAMRTFDALSRAVGSRATPSAARPKVSWAAATYATVWLSYFEAGTAEERGPILDWLTTRSLDDPEMLEDYAAEFDRALHPCG